MGSVSHAVALLFLLLVLDTRADPSSLPSVKPPSVSLNGTLPDTGAQTFQPASQTQLARDIEAAYIKKHRPTAEDVTKGLDGTDKVVRIRTPLGANVCLNWRDVDRFNPGKGKQVFVVACNR